MRNKRTIIYLLLTVLVCSIMFLYRQHKLEILPHPWDFEFFGHYPNPSLVLDCDFPDLPDKMMVYLVDAPEVTEESVLRLAHDVFDIPAAKEHFRGSHHMSYSFHINDDYLSVNTKTGGFTWEKKPQVRIDRSVDPRISSRKKEEKSVNLPDDETCKKLAKDFLSTNGLIPKDARMHKKVSSRSPGKKTVGFYRTINGFHTTGNGAGIRIEIGDNSEIVHVKKNWQKLHQLKQYPIKSPRQAFDEMVNGKGSSDRPKGKVKEISLKYYCSPMKQKYVQPVYM
ncbi:MAG: hypothetical protein KAS23_17500, partial [Anaerohalosphaera sp.]|nr:hypothetical protein [Anaerohalosphaera sp.]